MADTNCHVFLLGADLAFASHVLAAGDRRSYRVEQMMTVEQLMTQLTERQPRMVLIDLSMHDLDLPSMMPLLREALPADAQIIAFGPHVHKGKLQAAADSGCDQVMTRGRLFAEIDTVLDRICSDG